MVRGAFTSAGVGRQEDVVVDGVGGWGVRAGEGRGVGGHWEAAEGSGRAWVRLAGSTGGVVAQLCGVRWGRVG